MTNRLRFILFGCGPRGIIRGDSVPGVFIPRLVDLFNQGRFPVDRLIKTYAFEDIDAAAEDVETGHTIKAVLTSA
ncbi:hypothetical protein RKE30_38115 [Streptomyces sp. Li-HN-5-11]|uniref:hypothetical protein n=1 Tax=Streptomyces sp. Li-HN-5-11 TaxID=3075432 RepID=UPI0028AA3228|nr:hypothetical protein [Streptomyces sp. Li-HN-5-11]WNM35767.1 hypothetical protein RKE30_38115 [Streptomyces sp. Li-HN-5-11]